MKYTALSTTLLVCLLIISFFCKPLPTQAASFHKGEVIVKYKEGFNDFSAVNNTNIPRSMGEVNLSRTIEPINDLNIALIQSANESTNKLITKLKDDPNVEYVEPNYIRESAFTPNDPHFLNSWSHHNTGQTGGVIDADIDIPEGWDLENDTTDIIVAVIDTGIRYSHEDLINNLWDGSTCFDDLGQTISGGCPNYGWDYNSNDNDPNDEDGHGTFIAGIIGAQTNNATGISGVSRHDNIKIMTIRFGFDIFSEIKAINFAKNNGAKVINASYSGSGYSALEKQTIENFPGIFVTVSGNESLNTGDAARYPCNLDSPNVICVGATTDEDFLADFSSYSEEHVDITAPGENIISTDNANDSAYAIGNGTSFAAPFVAGTAAVLYSEKPSSNSNTIKQTLLKSSDTINELNGKITCSRRLNFKSSFENIRSGTIPSETCRSSVYRFWSDTKQAHFYTISSSEKSNIQSTYPDAVWRYEHAAFGAYANQIANTTAIYRFWSDEKQKHFYTASESEKNYVIATYPVATWRYEGIAYYAHASSQANTSTVHRFWSDEKQGHFYTASSAEKDHVIATYPNSTWGYEGIAWYVPN